MTNSGQDGQVTVISARTKKIVATVPVRRLPLFVAVNPKTNSVYATNQEDATVSVISGRTNTVTKTIRVGSDPQGVAVNPATGRVYVANLSGNTVSVLGGKTNRVTASIHERLFSSARMTESCRMTAARSCRVPASAVPSRSIGVPGSAPRAEVVIVASSPIPAS